MENKLPKKIIEVRPNGRKRVATLIEEPTLAQQNAKDQCDVNKIIARYKKTGNITHLRNKANGVYADLTNIPDYQQALNQVMKAEQAFMDLPSGLRNKFQNNPHNLITYLQNPNNQEEAIKLGLMERIIPEQSQAPQTPSQAPAEK